MGCLSRRKSPRLRSVLRATYAGLVALLPLCQQYPVLPVGAGSMVGLFANFALSRRLVFQ
jgi:hypothetical protein